MVTISVGTLGYRQLEVMAMATRQSFVDREATGWITLDSLAGVELLPLAQPVPEGSVHRARLATGTVIPVHTHPADEYVYVISGTVETGGRRCEAGTFWITPSGSRQGPHVAITDVELLTVRLGAMGTFGEPG
jgi:anti-sigma factor ChrR (cupin superfamily)